MAKKKEEVKAKGIGKRIGNAIGAEIDKEIEKEKCGCKDKKWGYHHTSADAVYGIGMIGAAVYFLQHSVSFWTGVLAILKAIVWPALLIYQALGTLGM